MDHTSLHRRPAFKQASIQRLTFALLMMACVMARAEWEVTSAAPEQVVYHDKQTRKSRGSIVRMWTMSDFAEVRMEDFGDFLSMRTLDAFDCGEKTHALVRAVFYSEKLGTGKVVHTFSVNEKELEWLPIQPMSVAEEEWGIACAR